MALYSCKQEKSNDNGVETNQVQITNNTRLHHVFEEYQNLDLYDRIMKINEILGKQDYLGYDLNELLYLDYFITSDQWLGKFDSTFSEFSDTTLLMKLVMSQILSTYIIKSQSVMFNEVEWYYGFKYSIGSGYKNMIFKQMYPYILSHGQEYYNSFCSYILSQSSLRDNNFCYIGNESVSPNEYFERQDRKELYILAFESWIKANPPYSELNNLNRKEKDMFLNYLINKSTNRLRLRGREEYDLPLKQNIVKEKWLNSGDMALIENSAIEKGLTLSEVYSEILRTMGVYFRTLNGILK